MVRVEGLEPTHLAALDPKSSVSTNFTTPARPEKECKGRNTNISMELAGNEFDVELEKYSVYRCALRLWRR